MARAYDGAADDLFELRHARTVLLEAAAKSISFQFSTGDSGDNGLLTPAGAAGVPSVWPPSASAWTARLTGTAGGDNQTGYGTPHGLEIINAAAYR